MPSMKIPTFFEKLFQRTLKDSFVSNRAIQSNFTKACFTKEIMIYQFINIGSL